MAYGVNIVENADRFEVYNDKTFDSPRIDPYQIQENIKNELRYKLKLMLEGIVEAEADEQIGALRYERGTSGRSDYRNGHRYRSIGTSMGTVEIKVPRARNKNLSFSVFAKYKRRWKELDQLLLEVHIGGLSCRDAGERIAKLMGCSVSGTTIAGLKKALEDKLREFKNAPLKDVYKAIVLDGMFIRIKQCGKMKRPLVAVIGIKADGTEEILGMRICYSENSTEVEGLLRNIKERGVSGVNLDVVTIDGDRGLEAAVSSVYGNARIQSCTWHKINRLYKNSEDKNCGRKMMKQASTAFAEDNMNKKKKLLMIFCEKWRSKEPEAIRLFEQKLYRCFEIYALPKELRKKASTSGRCEGLFKQLRKRIRQIGAFDKPLSVELYVYGIICQKKWINVPGRSIGDPLLSQTTHSS
jgi:putative transposase